MAHLVVVFIWQIFKAALYYTMKEYVYYYKGANTLYVGQAGKSTQVTEKEYEEMDQKHKDDIDYKRLHDHFNNAYSRRGGVRDNTVNIIRNEGLDPTTGAQTIIFEESDYGFKNFEAIFKNFEQDWEYDDVGVSGGGDMLDFAEMAHIMYHKSRQGGGGRLLTNIQLGGQQQWTYKDNGLFQKIWQTCGFGDMTKIQDGSKRYEEYTKVVIRKWDTLDAVVKAISPLSYFVIRAILRGIEIKSFDEEKGDHKFWKELFLSPQFVYLLIGGRGKSSTRIQRAQEYLAGELKKYIQVEWEKAWDKIEAAGILPDLKENFQDLRRNGLQLMNLTTSPELTKSLTELAESFKDRIALFISKDLITKKVFQNALRAAVAAGAGSAAAKKVKTTISAALTIAGRGTFKVKEGSTVKAVKTRLTLKRSWFYTSINTNRKFVITPEWYKMILAGPSGWQNKKTPSDVVKCYQRWTAAKFQKQIGEVVNPLVGRLNNYNVLPTNSVDESWLKMWFLEPDMWLGNRLKATYEARQLTYILAHWDEFYRAVATATYGKNINPISYGEEVYYEAPSTDKLSRRRYKSSLVRGGGRSTSIYDIKYF